MFKYSQISHPFARLKLNFEPFIGETFDWKVDSRKLWFKWFDISRLTGMRMDMKFVIMHINYLNVESNRKHIGNGFIIICLPTGKSNYEPPSHVYRTAEQLTSTKFRENFFSRFPNSHQNQQAAVHVYLQMNSYAA